jgi:hypothetical protein
MNSKHDEAIRASWERMARIDGWDSARDDLTDEEVVFNERLGVHYTGPEAWKDAALHEEMPR